jgi:hypothetical protein
MKMKQSKGHFNSKVIKAAILILNIYFSNNPVNAQSENTLNVFPPTPNAAAIQKFTDVPVNLSSGLPQISVPIYNSDEKGHSIPLKVNISYHAGGIKVEDVASDVGIGWALDYGPIISRTVRGLPDDMPDKGYFYLASKLKSPGLYQVDYNDYGRTRDTAARFFKNELDAQADIFNVNIGTYSGKLVFGSDGSYVLVPKSSIKVKRILNQDIFPNANMDGFELLDNNGYKYYFIRGDLISNNLMGNITPSGFNYSSTWVISRIESPGNTRSVVFSYIDTYQEYFQGRNETKYYPKTPGNTEPDINRQFSDLNGYSGNVKKISSILMSDGVSIRFNYDALPRKDINSGGPIDQIKIAHGTDTISYLFYFSYGDGIPYRPSPSSVSSSLRLRLDSVKQKALGVQLPPYIFKYNGNCVDRLSSAQDYWGYPYNGNIRQNSNTLIAQKVINANQVLRGADRRPDSTYVGLGSIKEIIYPTGGKTKFTFEINRAGDNKLNEIIVKTVTPSINLQTFLDTREQVFSINRTADSTKSIRFYYNFSFYCPEQINQPACQVRFKIVRPSDQLVISQAIFNVTQLPSTTYQDVPVINNGNYILKWEYLSSNSCTSCNDPFGFILNWKQEEIDTTQLVGGQRIKEVTMFTGDGSTPSLTTRYFYSNSTGKSSGSIRIKPSFISDYREVSGSNGFLSIFEKHSSSSSYPAGTASGSPIVYEQVETQQIDLVNNKILGKEVVNHITYDFQSATPPCADYSGGNCFPYFVGLDITEHIGLEKSRKIFSDLSTIIKESRIKYHYEEKAFDSDSKFRSFVFAATHVYNADTYTYLDRDYDLVFREFYPVTVIVNKIADTTIIYDGSQKIVQTNEYVYDTIANNLILTKSRNGKDQETALRLFYPYNYPGIAVYDSMKARNILSTVIQDSLSNFTLNKCLFRKRTNYSFWNNGLLIAPSNFQKAILDNGFETEVTFSDYDNKGNLRQSLQKNGIIEAYIWGYNQEYPVASVTGKTYSDVLSQSSINLSAINFNSSDVLVRAELNKLRGMPNTFVRTFTYKYFGLITCVMDYNNRSVYYEYDNFNRLKVIRDMDKNIIKMFDYQYQTYAHASPVWQTISGPTCEVIAGNNTGNQITVQQNVNPQSASFGQTQNVVVSNNTACPTNASITCRNFVAVSGYTARFTNTTTNTQYNFPISTSMSLQNLGTIPAGNYNLSFLKTGASVTYVFGFFCGPELSGTTPVNFYNITIGGGTCNSIFIDSN